MALNNITVIEDLTNEDIIKQIEDMMTTIETSEFRKLKNGNVGKYREELETRFPHLAGRYPQVFIMVMMYERTFDMEKMKWMLQMLDKRKKGEISVLQSDNIVSFKQFDEHVRPKINYDKEQENLERAKRGELDTNKGS